MWAWHTSRRKIANSCAENQTIIFSTWKLYRWVNSQWYGCFWGMKMMFVDGCYRWSQELPGCLSRPSTSAVTPPVLYNDTPTPPTASSTCPQNPLINKTRLLSSDLHVERWRRIPRRHYKIAGVPAATISDKKTTSFSFLSEGPNWKSMAYQFLIFCSEMNWDVEEGTGLYILLFWVPDLLHAKWSISTALNSELGHGPPSYRRFCEALSK